MAEKSSKERVNWWTFDDSIRSDVNAFDLRQHLFDFGIDSDYSLNENKAIPGLKEEFHQNQKSLDINLEDGMTQALENKKLITNYDNNRKQLWTHFLRCLQKHKTIAEEEPTFVTLSAVISDFFGVDKWDSTVFALKYNGVIYLFRNESLELEEEVDGKVTPHAYYLLKFQYLISDKNDSDVNGFEKCLSVDRIVLSQNKLIVCHGFAANHRNGSPVYVKCRQITKRFMADEYKYRLLRDWSNCVIGGAQTLILGKRYKSTLQEVIVKEVDKIPVECRSYWSDSKCFSFVDQSLEFIKSCVGSELELYEFAINCKDKTLSCFRHQSNDNSDHFLPKFYIQSELGSVDD